MIIFTVVRNSNGTGIIVCQVQSLGHEGPQVGFLSTTKADQLACRPKRSRD